jgi:hypothetical protein
MTTALAERDDVTIDGEIVEHRAPLTLFGTDDPSAVVERATKVATVLADVIKQRRLSARIGNRDHIMLEGWTLLGSMLGVFGEVEWTRSLDNGWEARAVARTMAGTTVGSAEAMCTRAERTWSQRDEYAIRSMAQTRALSKALRLPLGFIVELAGFAATPAEEMDGIQQPERDRGGIRPSSPNVSAPAPRPRTPEEQALADEIAALPGMTRARMSLLADAVRVPKGERATADQLREMLRRAEQPGAGVPPTSVDGAAGGSEPAASTTPDSDGPPSPQDGSDPATPEAGDPPSASPPAALTMDAVLAVTGGEDITPPPKKGTPEYGALTAPQKASARAYWQARGES